MEKKMEILAQSLQMAVDQTFRLDEETQYELNFEMTGSSQVLIEEVLTGIRFWQLPGLRQQVAEGLCSGDIDEIQKNTDLAEFQAINGYQRKMARLALQDAKIRASKRWSQYNWEGYML